MKQKKFYAAFQVIYKFIKDGLGFSQKEELYRLMFRNAYLLAGDDLYDNDTIRKVTTGNCTIHRKAVKVLCTNKGFEAFRMNIEKTFLPKLLDRGELVSELQSLLNGDFAVPNHIKKSIGDSVTIDSDYQISRAIAAILICLDHSDYLCNKGKGTFIDVNFMRLVSDRPAPRYPNFISDSPDTAVEKLIGREDDMKELYTEIVENKENLMISAVGGLGKTELVKMFLKQLQDTRGGFCLFTSPVLRLL